MPQAYLEALPRLTSLTKLCWRGGVAAGVLQQLPASVVEAVFTSSGSSVQVQYLADKLQLQQLQLGFSRCDTTALASLSALTNLQRLALRIPGADNLAQHGSSLAALPALKDLQVATNDFSLATASAIAAATSITNLQLRCQRDYVGDLAAAYEPLPQLQRLSVIHDWPPTGRSLASFGAAFSRDVTHLLGCGIQLFPLARTTPLLQVLILDTGSLGDEDLEAMGHYMQELRVLGIAIDGLISVAGVRAALSGGRFPALRKLVATSTESAPDAPSRAEVDNCVADVRPHVEVEHLASFHYSDLRKTPYIV
jgi:hypothetical protein